MLELLLSHGHAGAWNYTPLQASGWARLVKARLNHDHADALAIAALGARGKSDSVDSAIKDWRQEP